MVYLGFPEAAENTGKRRTSRNLRKLVKPNLKGYPTFWHFAMCCTFALYRQRMRAQKVQSALAELQLEPGLRAGDDRHQTPEQIAGGLRAKTAAVCY